MCLRGLSLYLDREKADQLFIALVDDAASIKTFFTSCFEAIPLNGMLLPCSFNLMEKEKVHFQKQLIQICYQVKIIYY